VHNCCTQYCTEQTWHPRATTYSSSPLRSARHPRALRRSQTGQEGSSKIGTPVSSYRQWRWSACLPVSLSDGTRLHPEVAIQSHQGALDAASGGMKSTWRVAQRLLHTSRQAVQSRRRCLYAYSVIIKIAICLTVQDIARNLVGWRKDRLRIPSVLENLKFLKSTMADGGHFKDKNKSLFLFNDSNYHKQLNKFGNMTHSRLERVVYTDRARYQWAISVPLRCGRKMQKSTYYTIWTKQIDCGHKQLSMARNNVIDFYCLVVWCSHCRSC